MRTGGHLQAQFRGSQAQQRKDYVWFALGGTSPLVPDATRSARIIVRAVKRGDPECTYTLPFWLANRFHGLAPATTVRLMRVANAMLPSTHEDEREPTRPGKQIDPEIKIPGFRLATVLGRRAAHAYNPQASGAAPLADDTNPNGPST
jgi:hypothetical protein